MNTDVKHYEESPSAQRTFPRRIGWTFSTWMVIWVVAVIGVAVSNPGEQAHRDALANKPYCQYHNYLLFSTMTTIELSGEERKVSTGFFGTVTTSDNAQ